MDLGGSSTQIAVPPLVRSGGSLVDVLDETHTYVRSFLSFGMERMRQHTFATFQKEAHLATRARHAVANPCAFFGQTNEEEKWRGTGDARGCQLAIQKVIVADTESCRSRPRAEKAECMPMGGVSATTPSKSGTPRFFLISGFMFVTDCARWWLERPDVRASLVLSEEDSADAKAVKAVTEDATVGATFHSPTVSELRAAAAALCAEPWPLESSTPHKFTSPQKLAHRCFELNYIIVLLSIGYGFKDDDRAFKIVDQIEGKDVEWSLGSFIYSRAMDSTRAGGSSNLRQFGGSASSYTAMLAAIVVSLGFLLLCVRRSICGDSHSLRID
eukprot:TRINITY_DN52258_c0_g1_i1.p1 TRINITY_DN52258_c0_g1~~TRINITY_DN52258_c0_g1_i1.p1  ORF type:complete len:329 (-),score=54.16 TRINITY_DN52258_c0_g1_i1:514-1500(-)